MSTRTRPRWRRWRDYSVPCKKGGGLGCQVRGPVGRGIEEAVLRSQPKAGKSEP